MADDCRPHRHLFLEKYKDIFSLIYVYGPPPWKGGGGVLSGGRPVGLYSLLPPHSGGQFHVPQ